MAEDINAPLLARLRPGLAESSATGRGIAIGVIDYGFDLLHPTLLDASRQHTRLQYLWDQNTQAWPVAYADGRHFRTGNSWLDGIKDFDARQIDLLIADARDMFSRDPVDTVYDCHANSFRANSSRAHGTPAGAETASARGTLMASAAAGSTIGQFRGVAPDADIIAVHLGLKSDHCRSVDEKARPPWSKWSPGEDGPDWTDWRNWDEAPQLLAAIDYIYDRAQRIGANGVVICFADGGWPGLHDGSSSLERKIEAIVSQGANGAGPPAVFVAGTGFSGGPGASFATTLPAAATSDFIWRVDAGAPTPVVLELSVSAANGLAAEVALADPTSTSRFGAIAARFETMPGATLPLALGRRLSGIISHQILDGGAKARLRLALHPPHFPASMAKDDDGRTHWLVRLRPSRPCELRVAIDDGGQSQLDCRSARSGAAVSLRPSPWTRGVVSAVQSLTPDPGVALRLPAGAIAGAQSKTSGFIVSEDDAGATGFAAGALALALEEALRRGSRRLGGSELAGEVFSEASQETCGNVAGAPDLTQVEAPALRSNAMK